MRFGPVRLTLAHVAAEAGLAPATLVQRFGSKKALLAAAFRLGNARLRAAIDTLPAGPHADGEALVAFLADLARGFGDRATMADNISMLSEDLRDPELSAIAAERSAILRAAAERLMPATSLPRPAAAAMVEAHWHGAAIQAALTGEPDIAVAVERALRALLVVLEAAGTR